MTSATDRLEALRFSCAPKLTGYRPRQDNGPKPAHVTHARIELAHIEGYIVYELLDAAGAVLYVGQTQDLADRLATHRRMASARYTQFATFREMVAEEARLIIERQPPWNVVGRSAPALRPRPMPTTTQSEQARRHDTEEASHPTEGNRETLREWLDSH